MPFRRTQATQSVVTLKIAALTLLVVIAVPGCSSTPAGAPVSGAPTAMPSTGIASASPSGLPSAIPAAASSFDPAFAASLQTALDRMVKVLHYPALSAAVILPDGTSWSGAAGKADVAAGTPATPDTSFAAASITKTFIAALVLELVQDGVLSLDDPIGKWLPQLKGDARFAADRVTIRQLLDHTSGIADLGAAWAAVWKDPTRPWTPDELIALIGDPTFAPGTGWAYSNTNYILAGMIIERASGSTVASLLRRRILDPLGLGQTVLQPQEQPAGPTAHGYSESAPGGTLGKPVDMWDGSGFTPDAGNARAVWTAGGIASTAPDLARWAAALYGGHVLDPASLAAMLDFGRNAGLPGGGTYGLGAVSGARGLGNVKAPADEVPAVGHGGGLPGFRSEMWYLTNQRVTIVVLTNTDRDEVVSVYMALQALIVKHRGS